MRFLFPPELVTAPSPLHWQGPSPLPQRHSGIRTGRGPKAPGQRPTRPRRALRPRRVGRWPLSLLDLRVYKAPFRAGGGNAGRVSCSRPDGRSRGCPESLAGAIAPATAPRRDQDQPGAQAPGQRPPSPRRALCAHRGRALASVLPGPAGLQGTVARGRGKHGSRFLFPPKGAIPVPGPERSSRQAGSRIAFSAPC
jgi:hypothetical protein